MSDIWFLLQGLRAKVHALLEKESKLWRKKKQSIFLSTEKCDMWLCSFEMCISFGLICLDHICCKKCVQTLCGKFWIWKTFWITENCCGCVNLCRQHANTFYCCRFFVSNLCEYSSLSLISAVKLMFIFNNTVFYLPCLLLICTRQVTVMIQTLI